MCFALAPVLFPINMEIKSCSAATSLAISWEISPDYVMSFKFIYASVALLQSTVLFLGLHSENGKYLHPKLAKGL